MRLDRTRRGAVIMETQRHPKLGRAAKSSAPQGKIRKLLTAAREAFQADKYQGTVTHCETALSVPHLSLSQEAELRCLLAEAQERQARLPSAISTLAKYESLPNWQTLPPEWQAQVRLRLGSALVTTEIEKALAYARQSLAIAGELRNAAVIGHSHLLLARSYRRLGETGLARNHYQEALKNLRPAGDRRGMAESWLGLGTIRVIVGELERGRDDFRQARLCLGKDKAPYLLGRIDLYLAQQMSLGGKLEESIPVYERAIARFGRAGTPRLRAIAFSALGLNLIWCGEVTRARQMLETALELAREVGARVVEASTMETLGELLMMQGEVTEAKALVDRSLEILRGQPARFSEAQALVTRGRIALMRGQGAEAEEDFDQSLKLARHLGDQRGTCAALLWMVETRLERGEWQSARQLLAKISLEVDALGNGTLIGHQRELAGRLAITGAGESTGSDDKLEEAARQLRQAVAIFRFYGKRYSESNSCLHLGHIYLLARDFKKARAAWQQALATFRELEARQMVARAEQLLAKLSSSSAHRSRDLGVRRRRRTSGAAADFAADYVSALLRLQGAAFSRDFLLHELVASLHDDLGASPVVVWRSEAHGRLIPQVWRGCTEAEARKIGAEVVKNQHGKARSEKLASDSPPGRHLSFPFSAGDDDYVLALNLGQTRLNRAAVAGLINNAVNALAGRKQLPAVAAGKMLDQAAEESEFHSVVVKSAAMREVVETVRGFHRSDTKVLITGETGTGKEVIARLIHQVSARADRPFVSFNCAAVPETLIESELFGHRKGAFTGAERNYPGLIGSAEGGTIFLDEVGDLPLSAQAKLLRFLDRNEIQPLGETKPRVVDVRVIAATHRDLSQMVAEGKFRADVYYRLNVINLHLPPLRERREEIPYLIHHLLKRLMAKAGKEGMTITPQAVDLLLLQDWPGNVRELANVLEQLVALTPEGAGITVDRLPLRFRQSEGAMDEWLSTSPATGSFRADLGTSVLLPSSQSHTAADDEAPKSLAEIERQAIMEALARHRGNIAHAAKELGITPQGLRKKLKRSGLPHLRH